MATQSLPTMATAAPPSEGLLDWRSGSSGGDGGREGRRTYGEWGRLQRESISLVLVCACGSRHDHGREGKGTHHFGRRCGVSSSSTALGALLERDSLIIVVDEGVLGALQVDDVGWDGRCFLGSLLIAELPCAGRAGLSLLLQAERSTARLGC